MKGCRRTLGAALCTFAIGWLSACSSVPTGPTGLARPSLNGKLAYQMEAGVTQRAQAGSALFVLQGDARQGELALNSPLGTSLATARWTEQAAWLDDGRGTSQHANLDALGAALGDALQGPPLPLRILLQWLQTQGSAVAPPLDAQAFAASGWQAHQPAAKRLVLTRPAQGGLGALRLNLVLLHEGTP